jgi:hypothetical protein
LIVRIILILLISTLVIILLSGGIYLLLSSNDSLDILTLVMKNLFGFVFFSIGILIPVGIIKQVIEDYKDDKYLEKLGYGKQK